MLKESEKYKDEDEKNRLRIEAKNDLENYVYNTRNSVSQATTDVAKEIKPDVERIVKETTEWLDANTTASTEEYKDKKKELEEELAPIMAKLYATGANGGMPSDMPDMSQFTQQKPSSASNSGPHIEEVD
jgi:L1 cell adhesion molecule like protein